MPDTEILTGIVHGRTIELDRELTYPEGQAVTVVLQPVPGEGQVPRDGLAESFGAWADDAEGLEEFLEWNRQQRKQSRPEIAE